MPVMQTWESQPSARKIDEDEVIRPFLEPFFMSTNQHFKN